MNFCTSTTDDGSCTTACILMKCLNADERNWLKCEKCSGWYHCSCANVTLEEAEEESFHFFCFKCSLM